MCWNFRKPSKRSSMRGQVLPIVALLTVFFIGFAALAVDLGADENQSSLQQNAADGAALAAAWYLSNNGTGAANEAGATAKAQTVITANNNATGLGMAFATGYPLYGTAGSGAVNKVTVQLVANQQAFFAQAAGLGGHTLTTTASASLIIECGICALGGGTDLTLNPPGGKGLGTLAAFNVKVTNGNVQSNNNAVLPGALNVFSCLLCSASLTASGSGAIKAHGTFSTGSGWTVSPTPITSAPMITDPLADLIFDTNFPQSTPVVSNTTYSAPSGPLAPGYYYGLTVPSGNTVTMTPSGGNSNFYIGHGGVSVAGILNGTGTIGLGCSLTANGNPGPCNGSGGAVNPAAGFTLPDSTFAAFNGTAPATGPLANLLIYADPSDTQSITLNFALNYTFTGGFYIKGGTIDLSDELVSILGANIVTFKGVLVANNINLSYAAISGTAGFNIDTGLYPASSGGKVSLSG